jgi:hypothetical protein
MRNNLLLLSAIMAMSLVSACASSQGKHEVRELAMPESAIVHSRDFIARDEAALHMFNATDSLAMSVVDAVTPMNVSSIADIKGLVESLYPERTDFDYLRDSLNKVGEGLSPEMPSTQLHLSRLSTSPDSRATLMYVRIDSTLKTGYYAIMAYLYKNRHADEAEDGTAISYDAMLAYFLVYNPQGELILARREEGERSHP